jgi:hypothetical protein
MMTLEQRRDGFHNPTGTEIQFPLVKIVYFRSFYERIGYMPNSSAIRYACTIFSGGTSA